MTWITGSGAIPKTTAFTGTFRALSLGALSLDGRVALVTGATRGQGESEARLVAAGGSRVVVADVLDDECAAVASPSPTARFLLSPDARYLTGNTLMVDGGSCPIT